MASGKCGKNLTWSFSGDTLVISGTGDMDDYEYADDEEDVTPSWNNFSGAISIKKIIIYDGVTSIGDWAFNWCERLKEIKIPDSVTSIGYGAFSECRNLTEIRIPDGVTYIDDWAFDDCISLTEIKIPDSVTSIGDWAFSECRNLTEIRIPDSVTSIGEGAFYSCDSLTEIKIPDSVTSIGEGAFSGCRRLKKIYCKRGTGFESILREGNRAEIIYYDATPPAQVKTPSPARKPTPKPAPEKLRWKIEGKTLTVGGVRVIKDYSREHPPWLANLRDIQSIVIAEGVEKISANAFAECTRLELLTIPASVKTIGDCAFTFCHCGDRSVNGGKNVLWSLDNGVLTFKKNPAAKSDANFSLGAVSWRAVDKNVTGVKLERGIIPDKRFFDWLGGLSSDVPVSF